MRDDAFDFDEDRNKHLLELLVIYSASINSDYIQHRPDLITFAKWLNELEYRASQINIFQMLPYLNKLPSAEFAKECNSNDDYYDCVILDIYEINGEEFTLFYNNA